MGHDAHGHGHGAGADHVPHILPLTTYFKTFGALLVLTAITVGVSYVDLGPLNLIVALLVATIKASVVALMFMHLFWDHKFFAIIFSSSIIFLAIFLAFTMFDTEARGIAETIEKEHPADYKVPFAGTKSEAKMKAELAKQAAAAPGAPAPAPAPGAPAPAPAPAPAAPAPAPH